MRKYACLALVVLLLAGCTAPTQSVSTTKATMPEKSPMEMLGQTVQMTLEASSFVIEYAQGDGNGKFTPQFSGEIARDTRGGYLAVISQPCGCGEYISGKTAFIKNCEDGSVEQQTQQGNHDIAYLLRFLPPLEKEVLQRFCNTGLTASPSRDGSMRFEVNGLNEAQMEQLLGVELDTEGDFQGYFALVLDAYGNLTEAEYTEGSVVHRIRVTKINQKLDIQKPTWA